MASRPQRPRRTAKPAVQPEAPIDLTDLRQLARVMSESDLCELEVEDQKKGLRLRLKRGGEPSAAATVHYVGAAPAAPAASAAPAPASGAASAAAAAAAPAAAAAKPEGVPFASPMVGTFYRAPSPEAEPFVEVGSRIEEDSVICIIEAMKVMNEIKAELRGRVLEVLVQNGEPVEFGQPLFLIQPA